MHVTTGTLVLIIQNTQESRPMGKIMKERKVCACFDLGKNGCHKSNCLGSKLIVAIVISMGSPCITWTRV